MKEGPRDPAAQGFWPPISFCVFFHGPVHGRRLTTTCAPVNSSCWMRPWGGEPAWGRWVLSSKDRIVADRDARRTRRGCGCARCCRVDHHASHAHVVVEHVRMGRVFPIDAFSGVPRRRSVVRMSRAGEVPARIQAAQRCCAAGTRFEGSGHPITRLRFARGLQRCSYMLGAGLSLASDAPSTACQQHRWVRTPRSVQGYAETNLVRFG